MILEREIGAAEMLDWLQAEAQSRQVALTVFRNDVEKRTEKYGRADGTEHSYTYVIVRVRFDDVSDPEEEASLKVRLQETWNNREPRPEKLLHLISYWVPQGVY